MNARFSLIHPGRVVSFDYVTPRSGPTARHGIVNELRPARRFGTLVNIYDYTATPQAGFRSFHNLKVANLRVLGPVREVVYKLGLRKLALYKLG